MASSSSSSAAAAARPPRSYASAIEALNTLQSNAATIAATRAAGGKYNDWLIPEMVEYLERAGHSHQELDRLNVIHITGTKGKGSTAAFSNSLLLKALADTEEKGAASGPRVGLYTSPHMLLVRERIRLDGMPIDEATFTSAFWRIWDAFDATADRRARPDVTPARPVYFKFMTVLALHVFLSTPSIRAVILEVGIGGRYDSTNIVPRPVACGVSTLSLDHQVVLGNTIEEIASQKAGIYKKGAPAISVAQPFKQTEAVLRKSAEEVVAQELKILPEGAESAVAKLPLGLPGPHQISNAQLALELVEAYLKAQGVAKSVWREDGSVTEWAAEALSQARWPGRCQIVPTPSAVYYLDGAHTSDSLALCAQWWQEESPSSSSSNVERTLIFNCTNGRNANELLTAILSAIQSGSSYFTRVIFCTNTPYRPSATQSGGDLTNNMVDSNEVQSLAVQRDLEAAWKQLAGAEGSDVHVLPSIEDALALVPTEGQKKQQVMVAGSLHLVGGVMSHLKDAGALDEKLEAVSKRT